MNNNFWLKLKFPVEMNGLALGTNFPEIGLPHKIEQADKDAYLVGYFADFEGAFDKKDLLKEIKKWGFGRITNSNTLFLLFYFDKRNQTLIVAVDQFLSFSCYFSSVNDELIFSSAFGPIKNELRKTKRLEIDTDSVLSYLLWEWPNTDHTLVKQIKVLPGGSKATFDLKNSRNYKIETQIDINAFYRSIPIRNYDSLESFSKDWLALLIEVLEQRVGQIPSNLKIGCDVSSGYDCALIAYCLSRILPNGEFTGYSNYSQIMGDENNLEIVKSFANQHRFHLETFDYTENSRHLNNLDHDWSPDEAVQPFVYVHHKPYIRFLRQNDIRLLFTGEFGDESYDMKQMELFSRFPVQQGYFDSVTSLKRRRKQDLFADNTQNIFLDQRRFHQRGYYPLIVPSKSVACYLPVIEAYGNLGINRLHVFNDTRVLALANQAPLPEGIRSYQIKELMMPYFRSIMPENYTATSNAGEPFTQMFINQKPLVNSVLSKSILTDMGLIDSKLLRQYVNNSQSDLYTDKTCQRAMQLYQIIILDWYLQKNDIS